MKDIELPSLPTDMMLQSDGEWVRTEKNTLTATEAKAYARAAVEADRAQRVPDDFLSHRSAWRAALVIAQGFAANEDDSDYWSHEIKAFDRAYSRLLASTQAPAQQEPSQIKAEHKTVTPSGTVVTRLELTDKAKESLRANVTHIPGIAKHQAPPQQERKPLTDEQIYGLYKRAGLEIYHIRDSVVLRTYDRCINDFARAIEQAHGIKE